jgi:membrane protein DedA with SNARE-associated domain
MSALGSGLHKLLGGQSWMENQDLSDSGIKGTQIETVMDTVSNYAKWSCVIVLSICSLLVGLYAVYLGFKMAKAADDGARKEAKQHVIYAIIGMVAIVAVAGLIGSVMGYQWGNRGGTNFEQTGDATTQQISVTVLNYIEGTVKTVLSVLSTLATLFAVYVGWKFMSAADDQKRKDAKMQLMYTVIAIVAMVLVNVIANAVLAALGGRFD